jgi:uncharacterized membrane protein
MMLGFGMLGMLVMLLLWGGLIVLSVWLVSLLFPRNSRGTTSSANNDLSPRQILDSRYARGELTRDQYELMKQDLT